MYIYICSFLIASLYLTRPDDTIKASIRERVSGLLLFLRRAIKQHHCGHTWPGGASDHPIPRVQLLYLHLPIIFLSLLFL